MMNITFEFACQDDCLDKMVPSDLRKIVRERDELRAERDALAAKVQTVTDAFLCGDEDDVMQAAGRLVDAAKVGETK